MKSRIKTDQAYLVVHAHCPACQSVLSRLYSADVRVMTVMAYDEIGSQIAEAARSDVTPVFYLDGKTLYGADDETVMQMIALYREKNPVEGTA